MTPPPTATIGRSLDAMRVNPDWVKHPLFDRKGWKRLPFGAFAESVNERAEPSEAAEEIYVGLEHIDPQDLHIRRWGKGGDVIGTKLRFRKDDRRDYRVPAGRRGARRRSVCRINEYIDEVLKGQKRGAESTRILGQDLLPVLGQRPAIQITRRELQDEVIRPKMAKAPRVATQLLSRIRCAYAYAIEQGRLTSKTLLVQFA